MIMRNRTSAASGSRAVESPPRPKSRLASALPARCWRLAGHRAPARSGRAGAARRAHQRTADSSAVAVVGAGRGSALGGSSLASVATAQWVRSLIHECGRRLGRARRRRVADWCVTDASAGAPARPRSPSLGLTAQNTSRESAGARGPDFDPCGFSMGAHVRERAFSDVSPRMRLTAAIRRPKRKPPAAAVALAEKMPHIRRKRGGPYCLSGCGRLSRTERRRCRRPRSSAGR